MATTEAPNTSGNANKKNDQFLDQSVKGVALDPKTADAELRTRVDALWGQMNKGVSNEILLSIVNNPKSTTVNKPTQKLSNNNWMTYLGLAPKGTGTPRPNGKQKGPEEEQNNPNDEAKTDASLPEQLNKGAFTRSTVNTTQEPANNWATYLGLAPKKTESPVQNEPQKGTGDVQNGSSDEARRIAAAALAAVKDAAAAAAAAASRGKVEITQIRDFAGQEIEYRKLVDADSKEASEKTKPSASSAVDAVLEQIRKKPKLSVLDKTKKDWGEFKEENKGMEEELDAYKKSSNQYLDKVSFLQRTEYREFERERDARLAVQAKKRPDMREEL